MHRFRFLLAAVALLFVFSPAGAQGFKADPTTWTFEVKKTGDKKYQLIFHLKLKSGWHIWSQDPGGDGLLVPPTFTFNKSAAYKLVGKIKERGKRIDKEYDGTDGITHSYEGSVDYTQDITVTGNVKITGKHEYQVCDHESCLRPVTKPFTFEIKDAGGSADTVGQATIVPSTDSPVTTVAGAPTIPADTTTGGDPKKITTVKAEGPFADVPENMNLWLLFALCFLGGLLAITTPCVYSMVPITVSFFTKRSKTRAEAIRNASYYSLSIIIIFTVLGVFISAFFGAEALYKLSSNWIANLIFFAIFIVFGISFLGAFEITLPSSWTSKTDSRAGTSSFKGIFFMAMTLVIVSFSCTSGIIGPLLVTASRGGLVGPALGMFGFSLGLALPFTFFAFSPGMINKMANAGGWLNQVKVTLGFIEIGLALKFFSNADLVKGWRILDREIFIAIWIVLSILLALYLLGRLKLSHDDANPKNIYGQEYVSLFKLFLVFCSLSFAIYLLPGMWGAPLKGLGQFLPPMGTFDKWTETSAHNTSASTASSGGLHPIKYADAMSVYEPDVVKRNVCI